MKKRNSKLYIFFILLILKFDFSFSQEQGHYEITGHIEGLDEGEKVSMILIDELGVSLGKTNADSTFVLNGNIKITGHVPEGPRIYSLSFEKHRNKPAILFINNNEKIKINSICPIQNMASGNIREWITIEGSLSDYAYASLLNVNRVQFNFFVRELTSFQEKINANNFNPDFIAGVITAKKLFWDGLGFLFREAFHFSPQPSFSLAIPNFLCLKRIAQGHPSFLKEIYSGLDENVKTSYYGKRLKQEADLCIGQTFPEFSLSSTDGKVIKLKDVIGKSKITVVNFWSSNSFERKKYIDQLKTLYQKYHENGLNIIGVSSDTSAIEWKLRVQADQLPWYNVSDLKGRQGIVQSVYLEYPVPQMASTTNVVLDSEGKILAWDVNGMELEWYIWSSLKKENTSNGD